MYMSASPILSKLKDISRHTFSTIRVRYRTVTYWPILVYDCVSRDTIWLGIQTQTGKRPLQISIISQKKMFRPPSPSTACYDTSIIPAWSWIRSTTKIELQLIDEEKQPAVGQQRTTQRRNHQRNDRMYFWSLMNYYYTFQYREYFAFSLCCMWY